MNFSCDNMIYGDSNRNLVTQLQILIVIQLILEDEKTRRPAVFGDQNNASAG